MDTKGIEIGKLQQSNIFLFFLLSPYRNINPSAHPLDSDQQEFRFPRDCLMFSL